MGNSWEEKKLIGNFAENIIEFLVESMPDWQCVKFGVENHMMDLKRIVKREINSVTKRIKSMPDFIVFNKKTGKTFFIEAKYRGFIDQRNGQSEYKLDFLNDYNENWPGTKLIVVHGYEPYFFVINLKDIKQKMCRREQVGLNDWDYYWDFSEIQKNIREVFPELTEENIQKAIAMIPNKSKEKKR